MSILLAYENISKTIGFFLLVMCMYLYYGYYND